jgi:PKD repeat protein
MKSSVLHTSFSIIVVLIATLFCFTACEKEYTSWDLPRNNPADTLDNPEEARPPVANFLSSAVSAPIGTNIDFVNLSLYSTDSLTWTFEGGNPSISTNTSPVVTYNSIGKYDVGLKVINEFGSDSVVKTDFIESFYLKNFANNLWDGWSNNGWTFTNSNTCEGCILAYQNSTNTPQYYTITESFSNVPSGATLEFYYNIYSPAGGLRVKLNGVQIWSVSGFGASTASIPLSNSGSFSLTFEAVTGLTNSIYLNDIKIRP